MKLLSAKSVKSEKDAGIEELSARVKKLQAEEKRLLKVVADLDDKEKERVTRKEEIELMFAGDEAEIETRKTVLFQQVKHLESKRDEALKPINEIKKEADKYFEEAKQTVADANKRAFAVKEDTERLVERLEDVADKEAEAHNNLLDLTRRKAGIEAAEAELKRETQAVADKWIKYHEAVLEKTTELETRERAILDNQKANENYKIQLDLVAEEQRILKIGIKDGYESLERAKEEILKNK